jgi:tRNA (guanine37-N1)-methyltransferase
MRFDIITIFPEMIKSGFSGGVIRKALEKKLIEFNVHNLRSFARDKHRQVDDRPYGGSQGMVLKSEPIFEAVESVRTAEDSPVYLLSPQGIKFDYLCAEKMAGRSQIILICGRYEGVDERVIKNLITDEISIGDYILTGGEPAAMVIIDAVSRYVPGVVGHPDSIKCDSFVDGLLDFPHYTRPRDFRGMGVPSVLFSGNHEKIARWRRKKSLEKTLRKRPDLLKNKRLSHEDNRLLDNIMKGKDNESN